MYKLRGKILEKNTEQIKTDKGEWEKMTFNIEETETDFQHKYQFEIFGTEAINLQRDKIIEGNYITVHFYIKSREYKGRYYNTLMVKDTTPEMSISNEDNNFNKKANLPF